MKKFKDFSEIEKAALLLDELDLIPENIEERENIFSDINRETALQMLLDDMCSNTGVYKALISDSRGLVIASSSDMPDTENNAAVASIFGETLITIGKLLNHSDLCFVSLDFNLLDKISIYKFYLEEGNSAYLLVTSSQDYDVRAQLEIVSSSIRQILFSSKAGN
ncbi:MAG: hypothetical protein JXR95_13530 [Deltaproteobacteria bacterium]|nr:hypothetical protein [Deltaproteobacteria bacterium]